MEKPWARWLARDPDPETRTELKNLINAGDEAALRARFSGRLAFGTAGLRGVVGAGPMRMNRLVVQETSVGLARWIKTQFDDAEQRGVVVGFDGRLHSASFAQDCAAALAACGLKVYLSQEPVATPVCAFSVRHLGAAAGVVITASHNPPEYNGYKVFWANGAQIIPPHDEGIAAAIDQVASEPLPSLDPHSALIQPLPQATLEAYRAGVQQLADPPQGQERASLRIAYTPLHGVGAAWVEAALARAGFSQVHTVASQRLPDGRFPTVRFPNPEEPGAMDAVLELARQVDADLVLANDPDADRLAVAARDGDGYLPLTGNQIGVLLGSWLLEKHAGEPVCVGTTIVSSQMLGEMAQASGAAYDETLTGFKWIANRGMEREQQGMRFLFGYEEALGYTVGDLVRDKDGVSAATCFAVMVAELRARGETLLGRLQSLYQRYGLFVTAQENLPLGPEDSKPQDVLRAQPPAQIAGRAVLAYADLARGVKVLADGSQQAVGLPLSDVLTYWLEGGARVIVRPSGTEPKLKSYYEVRARWVAGEPFAQAQARAQQELEQLIEQHQVALKAATVAAG